MIVARFTGQGVEVPGSLTLEIDEDATSEPETPGEYRAKGWTEEVVVPEPQPIVASLTMLTTGETIQIHQNVFRIGREKQPKDRSGRPKPENHLYFGEAETSVSRQHAQICFDQTTRDYRLWDIGSTQGTKLLREGMEIEVPKSSRAPGVRVCSGDLIYFGKVGVRFQL
jgi:FHA domain-containing protein